MDLTMLAVAVRWCAHAIVLLAVAVVSGVGFRYCFIHANGNLHTVEQGVVYRSAQLSREDLSALVKRLGIRSVVNLRGENLGERWYDDEVQAASELGFTLINYRMSAAKVLTVAQMKELSLMLQGAPKPLLIHCRAGADRTGLASALYCVEEGMSLDSVRRQLSPFYGHFPVVYGESIAMDVSLSLYLGSKSTSPAPGQVGEAR